MSKDMLAVIRPRVQAYNVQKQFDLVEAAPTLPNILPRGEYEADWVGISVGESRTGKPRVVLSFEVIDDNFSGTSCGLICI